MPVCSTQSAACLPDRQAVSQLDLFLGKRPTWLNILNKIYRMKINVVFYNKSQIICIVNVHAWPTRSLIAKGYIGNNSIDIASRLMHDYEIREERENKRVRYWKYSNWNNLIQDEIEAGSSQKFIDKLIKASKKFPMRQ
jgi:hypothetical protein